MLLSYTIISRYILIQTLTSFLISHCTQSEGSSMLTHKMRYENWDVLLFPETSKVPIREFKTQCAVAQSKESPYTADPSLMSPQASYVPQTNAGLVPVLTTYIPSLAENTAFRVSIHSWERPRPSRLMENLMQPDDALLFMAQVYIDGDPVSTCVFGQRTSWPHVIEYSPHIDRDGNQEPLRFPLFHREMLEQSRWGASDLNGRVVIMITEGFARPNRSPPIERVRDLIAFSFLHAPQNILEMCNVAWPNPSMWSNTAQPFRFNPSYSYRDFKVQEDPHTHSPAKHESRTTYSRNQVIDPPLYNNWAYKSYPTPLQWPPSYNPRWGYPEQYIADPFADAYTAVNHNGARSYRDDISMPDWKSASSSSRAISNMTGISYEHSKQPSCVGVPGDERYDRVFRPYSPPKEPPIRQIPAPAPMAVHPTMLPPMGYRSSAAPGAHLVSLAKNTGHRTLASGLKGMSPPPGSRDVSVSSTKCNAPFQSSVEDESIEFYAGPDAHAKAKSSITILDDEQDGVTAETPRKESTKINYTPTKTTARSGEGTDPDKDPGIPSIGSSSGGFVPGSKPVAAAITPTKNQAPANSTNNSSGSNDSDDQIEQISFDDFAKSTLRIRDEPLLAVVS